MKPWLQGDPGLLVPLAVAEGAAVAAGARSVLVVAGSGGVLAAVAAGVLADVAAGVLAGS